MPSLDDDLRLIAEQERLLHFPSFNAETAWALGSALRAEALARKTGMTFEIQIAGRTLFACSTDTAAPGQADWVRRKRNVVMRFGRCSYAMGLMLEMEGKTIEQRHGLTLTDYALHGGGVPILLAGTGLVGSVVCSGLDQRSDHGLVVKAMAGVLGVDVPALQ